MDPLAASCPFMNIRKDSGIISGTPTTAACQQVHVVTAYNAGGTASTTLRLTVHPMIPSISYTHSSPLMLKVGDSVTISPDIADVNYAIDAFSVEPPFPPGSALDATTTCMRSRMSACACTHESTHTFFFCSATIPTKPWPWLGV